MTLYQIGARTHKWKKKATRKRPLSYHIAHLHSEVSECFEAFREAEKGTKGDPEVLLRHLQEIWADKDDHPEGFAIELADVVIIASFLAYETGIDLDRAVEIKSTYNEERAAARRKD